MSPDALEVMIDVQRELGGINEHLRNLDGKVSETLAQARATNGRVNDHDRQIAVLQSNVSDFTALEDKLKEVEGRPRLYLLGIGGPVLAALVTVMLAHGF